MAKAKSSNAAASGPAAGESSGGWGRHAGMRAAGIVLFIGVCAVAILAAKQYVIRDVATSAGPFIIVVKHRPAWMSDLLVRQLADVAQPPVLEPGTDRSGQDSKHHAGLAALIGGGDPNGYSSFDRDMLDGVYRRLAADPWVAEVRQVRRAYTNKPGDTIEIDCAYRVPIALVKWHDGYWLVSSDGYKLPGHYDPTIVPSVMGTGGMPPLRIIDGVRHAPPEAGEKWAGDDLKAGLEMIGVLASDPVADGVLKIDVSNYSGRMDPREAHLVLITKYNTQIRWGRPADDDQSFEISPAKKLQALDRIAAQYGRIDANQPWIDVRFDTVRIPSDKSVDGGSASGGGGDSHADVQQ